MSKMSACLSISPFIHPSVLLFVCLFVSHPHKLHLSKYTCICKMPVLVHNVVFCSFLPRISGKESNCDSYTNDNKVKMASNKLVLKSI